MRSQGKGCLRWDQKGCVCLPGRRALSPAPSLWWCLEEARSRDLELASGWGSGQFHRRATHAEAQILLSPYLLKTLPNNGRSRGPCVLTPSQQPGHLKGSENSKIHKMLETACPKGNARATSCPRPERFPRMQGFQT